MRMLVSVDQRPERERALSSQTVMRSSACSTNEPSGVDHLVALRCRRFRPQRWHAVLCTPRQSPAHRQPVRGRADERGHSRVCAQRRRGGPERGRMLGLFSTSCPTSSRSMTCRRWHRRRQDWGPVDFRSCRDVSQLRCAIRGGSRQLNPQQPRLQGRAAGHQRSRDGRTSFADWSVGVEFTDCAGEPDRRRPKHPCVFLCKRARWPRRCAPATGQRVRGVLHKRQSTALVRLMPWYRSRRCRQLTELRYFRNADWWNGQRPELSGRADRPGRSCRRRGVRSVRVLTPRIAMVRT